MDPKIWGKHFWNTINTIAISYPDKPDEDDKKNISTFMYSLANVLPCYKCQEHFKENLKKFPLQHALKSRQTLIHWVIDIHNSVNRRNGKREYSYEEGLYLMESNLMGTMDKTRIKYYVMFGMTICILLFWKLKK